LEEWDQAEPLCRKAVSLDPENSNFHLWLGRVYGEKADRTNFVAATSLAGKVHAEFERAVQLNPKNLEARLDLSEFYIEAPGFMGGGEQKARDQAQTLSTLSPGREHWVYARIAEKKRRGSIMLCFFGASPALMIWSRPSLNSIKLGCPDQTACLKRLTLSIAQIGTILW
jgi:hypothetical protein